MINYDDLNQNIKVGNPLKQKFCIERFLNKKDCEIIIKKSEELGEWTTKRHKNYICGHPAQINTPVSRPFP